MQSWIGKIKDSLKSKFSAFVNYLDETFLTENVIFFISLAIGLLIVLFMLLTGFLKKFDPREEESFYRSRSHLEHYFLFLTTALVLTFLCLFFFL